MTENIIIVEDSGNYKPKDDDPDEKMTEERLNFNNNASPQERFCL